jgi:hypothetical protein
MLMPKLVIAIGLQCQEFRETLGIQLSDDGCTVEYYSLRSHVIKSLLFKFIQ